MKDAVLRTTYTYTTKSGDKVVSTREVVKDFVVQDYNAKEKLVEKITTTDGKTYRYHGVYPISPKFNNVTAETGKVVEGTTTVVYQYDYDIPVKPTWQVPSDAPKNEVTRIRRRSISSRAADIRSTRIRRRSISSRAASVRST